MGKNKIERIKMPLKHIGEQIEFSHIIRERIFKIPRK